MRRGN